MERSLEGLKVVDLTQVVSGAVTTMLMADFGAEVIKVEPPGGEPYRHSGYPIRTSEGETNLNFMRFSRGKKSIALDLKSQAGRELLEDLVREADILVENFRPGVLTRLGFDYERLRSLNPRLIYTSVSGFGHDDLYESPYKDRPAYAIVTEAMAGLMHLAGDGEGPPVWLGFAMADIFSGSLALAGTLLALRDREITGEGRRVDIAMYDGALLMNDLAMAAYSVAGEVMGPGQYLLQSPWGPFEAADGYVVIAVLTEAQWASLCDLLEQPGLKADERLQSGRHRSIHHDELVDPAIREWCASRPKSECTRLLLEQGVPAAPVNTAEDVYSCPQAEARRMLIDVEDPVAGRTKLVGNPIKLDQLPEAGAPPRIPLLGEHTDEILAGLGASVERVAELRRAGAVGGPQPAREEVAR